MHFEVCQICGDADDVTRESLPDSAWVFTCSRAKNHPGGQPRIWIGSADGSGSHLDDPQGLAAEMDLYDDLIGCLEPEAPFVEYGIIEHRFSQREPDKYAILLARYGHTRQGPKQYTLTAFLSATLGWLRDHGEVVCKHGPATGFLSHNGRIWYWALTPGPSDGSTLSYREYATDLGVDPDA